MPEYIDKCYKDWSGIHVDLTNQDQFNPEAGKKYLLSDGCDDKLIDIYVKVPCIIYYNGYLIFNWYPKGVPFTGLSNEIDHNEYYTEDDTSYINMYKFIGHTQIHFNTANFSEITGVIIIRGTHSKITNSLPSLKVYVDTVHVVCENLQNSVYGKHLKYVTYRGEGEFTVPKQTWEFTYLSKNSNKTQIKWEPDNKCDTLTTNLYIECPDSVKTVFCGYNVASKYCVDNININSINHLNSQHNSPIKLQCKKTQAIIWPRMKIHLDPRVEELILDNRKRDIYVMYIKCEKPLKLLITDDVIVKLTGPYPLKYLKNGVMYRHISE